jgi:antagonist of KipI
MSTVLIESAGLQTTVQDLGRWGHQADGVPVSGAMDPFEHRRANALVGNDRGAATLEVTLTGPVLAFDDARTLAITGGTFHLFIDAAPVVSEGVIHVSAGSTLRFGERRSGARAYLAVNGGFDVPSVLGSRSTHVATSMGGWQGRALKKGDRLPLGSSAGVSGLGGTAGREPASFARATPGNGREPVIVRILKGPQAERFVDGAIEHVTAAPYLVTVDSNRMAYRLEGQPVRHKAGADIISDATPLGSLQVPASGQPVLLMADRQTTGGYPKIATVISADIGLVAQAAPGDHLHFRLCDQAEALAALIARERALLALERATTCRT